MKTDNAEQVISHLELLRDEISGVRRTIIGASGIVRRVNWITDAIALLKAQEQQATTPEAEWLLFNGGRGATCSYCKHTYYDVYDVENYDYYCRHCGARMIKIRTVNWND